MLDPVRVAAALANGTRLAILEAIFKEGVKTCCDRLELEEQGVCVSDMVSMFGLAQSTVSHHLGVLEAAGLIRREVRGLWTCYFPNPAALEEFVAALRGRLLPGEAGAEEAGNEEKKG